MTVFPRTRVVIGRDAQVFDGAEPWLWLEGPTRLRPGQCIEIISGDATPAPAVLPSWRHGASSR